MRDSVLFPVYLCQWNSRTQIYGTLTELRCENTKRITRNRRIVRKSIARVLERYNIPMNDLIRVGGMFMMRWVVKFGMTRPGQIGQSFFVPIIKRRRRLISWWDHQLQMGQQYLDQLMVYQECIFSPQCDVGKKILEVRSLRLPFVHEDLSYRNPQTSEFIHVN